MQPDVVRQAPLLSSLDDETATTFIQSMTRFRLERGDVLFREGDRGDRMYVIREGKIKLGSSRSDGRESIAAILGPGEMFGELSLFDPRPRTMTATALSETQLLAVSNGDLHGLLNESPDVGKALLGALARRLRRTNDNVADLVFADVPGRVARALLELSAQFGREVEQGLFVPHDLTQEELAQLVGASRETVNKTLGNFVARGWIRLEDRAVVLLNVERLRGRVG